MLAIEYDNAISELLNKRREFVKQATETIDDLGKFEGYSDIETLAIALYYHDSAMNGCDDSCFSDGNGGDSTTVFTISDYDRVMWRRLDDIGTGAYTTVYMDESNSGFVSVSWGDDSRVSELEDQYDDDSDSDYMGDDYDDDSDDSK